MYPEESREKKKTKHPIACVEAKSCSQKNPPTEF
jgi:hypothetical protein